MIGTVVAGRYNVIAQIGVGGMGIVYHAHDTRLKRDVALKVIAPHLVQQETARTRFLREAQALAGLSHPNIVTVYDMAEDPDSKTVFIVMELLRGQSLRQWMTAPDRPAISTIAAQICRALECAHGQGILHRDIKPENIFVCNDGTLKLMDFGLARLLGSASKSQSSMVAGTVAYMAPEQLRGEKLDARTDLYAVGVLFYEYLSGVTPFDGDNPGAILFKHLTESPPPLRSRMPGIAPEVEQVVLRLLEKEPANRFPSAAALREALEQPVGTAIPPAQLADSLPPPSEAAETASATTRSVPTSARVAPAPVATMPVAAATPAAHSLPAAARHLLFPIVAAFAALGVWASALVIHQVSAHPTVSAPPSLTATRSTASPRHKHSGSPSAGLVQAPASALGASEKARALVRTAAGDPHRISAPAHNIAPSEVLVPRTKLDEIARDQEQLRTEVDHMQRLLQQEEAQSHAASQKTGANTGSSTTGVQIPSPAGTRVVSPPSAPPGPNAGNPQTPVNSKLLQPATDIRWRIRPTRTRPDPNSVRIEVQNDSEGFLYFYMVREDLGQAVLMARRAEHLPATSDPKQFHPIDVPLPNPGGPPVDKLLVLAARSPLTNLPKTFLLPPVQLDPTANGAPLPPNRRLAAFRLFRDQVVITLQRRKVRLGGQDLPMNGVLVRLLRFL